MTDRPILFRPELVRAILAGTKTQTRRIVKGVDAKNWIRLPGGFGNHIADEKSLAVCPHGVPGDVLWVKEPWRTSRNFDELSPKQIGEACRNADCPKPWAPIRYEADGAEVNWAREIRDGFGDEWGRYRHCRFMPRWACRLELPIHTVRVERLHDITEADAAAEGVEPPGFGRGEVDAERAAELLGWPPKSRRAWFAAAWDRINGKRAPWASNPWVWVIEWKPEAIRRLGAAA